MDYLGGTTDDFHTMGCNGFHQMGQAKKQQSGPPRHDIGTGTLMERRVRRVPVRASNDDLPKNDAGLMIDAAQIR